MPESFTMAPAFVLGLSNVLTRKKKSYRKFQDKVQLQYIVQPYSLVTNILSFVLQFLRNILNFWNVNYKRFAPLPADTSTFVFCDQGHTEYSF